MQEALIIQNINREELAEMISQAVAEQMKSFTPYPKPKKGKYLTRVETAEKLRISLPTLNKLTKAGKLHGYRVGSRLVYHENEIEDAIR